MRRLAGILRLAIAVLIAVAIIATFLDTASRVAINPFNFFGFFTLQSNILGAIVLAVAGIRGLQGRTQTAGLMLARASVTTYLVIVGLVYNTLLVGVPGGGGIELDWANAVVHVVSPIYVIVDWLVFADRTAQPWSKFWVVFIYPLVWLAVVLVRGATDGWVPYPFLDPATGYGSVALYSIGIAIGVALFGALVWALSRVRIVPA